MPRRKTGSPLGLSRRFSKSRASSRRSRAARGSSKVSRAASAAIEGLESRQLLSACWVSNGVLTLQGNPTGYNGLVVDYASNGQLMVTCDGGGLYANPSSVHLINIIGGNGNDKVWINGRITIPCNIQTYGGTDDINGGGGNDTITVGDGNDWIDGRGGNDVIRAGNGNDVIYGDNGNDSITAGNGADKIWGENGDDTIVTGSGNSALDAGPGNDSVVAGAGNNLIYGQGGNDTLVAGTGYDTIWGGGGYNVLHGATSKTIYPDLNGMDTAPAGSVASSAPPPGAGGISGGLTQGGVSANNATITGSNGGDALAPKPVIVLMGKTGVGPHTVFVHALSSTLGAGTPLTAHYQWNFGDPSGKYNTLVGWNAAHTYDNPGTYTVTLSITNQSGKTRTLTTTVSVVADTRRTIYVDTNGSDLNNGLSPSTPIKTVARVEALMGSSTRVLFHAGEVFNVSYGITLPFHDVLIGSYGSGAQPVLNRVTGTGSSILSMFDNSNQIVIQNITLDSPWKPVGVIAEKMPADGIFPAGTNITIRNVTFLNLDVGIDSDRSPDGTLVQDCNAPLATGLRGVFIWAQGADQVYLGNTVANSTREHIIRSVQVDRELIAYNHLTNLDRRPLGDALDDNKGTVDIHRGTYAYVADNWLYGGELRAGPRSGPAAVPGDTTQWTVFDGNHTFGHEVQVYPGTYHLMIRNNVISMDHNSCISIVPANPAGDNVQDITIVNNTGITNSSGGCFLYVTSGAAANSLTVQNNLWIAPNLLPGTGGAAAIFVIDKSTAMFRLVSNNVWPMPKVFNPYAAGGMMYFWTSWAPPSGYYTPAAWNALPQVYNDRFSQIPVTSGYMPGSSSYATLASPAVAGVFADVNGKLRSLSGTVTAGAMQM
ncbi:MAG: domain containing protein [Phycisphaerales bacterium]|nr:domain containing protein [Phycisphaerales bacterium]MDB5354487.1 domain containing protein [Phycisphaerales bacterium]